MLRRRLHPQERRMSGIESFSREDIRELEQLSPFELKSKLKVIAGEHERRTAYLMHDAGVGNPNFTAPTPREAFLRMTFFALDDSRAHDEWDPELIGIPRQDG